MAVSAAEVSLLVGDPTNVLITTAQITTLAGLYGENSFTVAAAAARTIAATFGNAVNKRAGDVSINASDKFKHYMDLAAKLERQATLFALNGTSAYAGGISISDKDTQEADTDRVKPYFTRAKHDDPGRTDSDYDDDDLT